MWRSAEQRKLISRAERAGLSVGLLGFHLLTSQLQLEGASSEELHAVLDEMKARGIEPNERFHQTLIQLQQTQDR